MEGNTILQKYYQGTVFSLFIPILYVIKVYVYSLYDVSKDIYSTISEFKTAFLNHNLFSYDISPPDGTTYYNILCKCNSTNHSLTVISLNLV